jgi:hypothetical protein
LTQFELSFAAKPLISRKPLPKGKEEKREGEEEEEEGGQEGLGKD